MKFKLTSLLLLLITFLLTGSGQAQPTDILLVGADHFNQTYQKDNPNTDILGPVQQTDLAAFINLVMPYQPDLILVEVLPQKQSEMDSLYTLYRQNNLSVESLADGRSEVYQLGFRLAKQLGLPKVYCVNAPGGTSQSILDNGENIKLYKEAGLALRAMATAKMKALQEGKLSFKDYLTFLNQPETYNRVYRLRYMTPARVTNGRFKNPDAMVDTAFVDPHYIGAELTSVFKNRDYKIYSNIVTNQLKTNAKRVLLFIGTAHIGSLRSILRDDEAYNLVELSKYIPAVKSSR